MRKLTSSLLAVLCFGFLAPGTSARAADAYETEYQRAIQGLLANVQPNGAIIASPSRSEPNYYYNWVRDTALTMKAVVTLAYDPATSTDLKANLLWKIDRWIEWELHIQDVPKLKDLGEPRFNVDGSANNDPWNRPQNDGPALRALTAMMVAQHWLEEGRRNDVEQKLYRGQIPAGTMIKRDLEYVSHHWQEQSFDLWEEEMGMHFYTLTQQKVALIKGSALAHQMGDHGAGDFYMVQSDAITQYLEQFYDAGTGTLRATLDWGNRLPQKTSNLDISIVLASIQTFDGKFYVNADQVKATIPVLSNMFKNEYSINFGRKVKDGIALGRYPGDIYNGVGFTGANPWFLSTLAVAEFACQMDKSKAHSVAKAQFDLVLSHMGPHGELDEQFNRDTGYQQGAKDLTWSYTAYITAYRACFQ